MPETHSAVHTQDPPARADEMLLSFLRSHDAACPVCGYSLRGLERPICPECRQELALTVGAARLRLGLLLAALAPGFFSGIAACFLALFTTAIYIEDRMLVPPFVGAVLFGWCSGLLAILLAVKRTRFIAMTRARQRWSVLFVWLVHFGALVGFGLWLDPYIN